MYGFGIGDYRSFTGDELSRVGPCQKVHVITGQNNSGKSALLKAYDKLATLLRLHANSNEPEKNPFTQTDIPFRLRMNSEYRFSVCLSLDEVSSWFDECSHIDGQSDTATVSALMELLGSEGYCDATKGYCWIDLEYTNTGSRLHKDLQADVTQFRTAMSRLDADCRRHVEHAITSMSRRTSSIIGDVTSCFKAIVAAMLGKIECPPSFFIPAIRTIRTMGSTSVEREIEPSGIGLPERLLRFKNPSVGDYEESTRAMEKLEEFVRQVLNEPQATINVAAENYEISIRTAGSPLLSLSDLGTGVEELLILAMTVATTSNSVMLIEEPEIHLHPTLLRRLVAYLQSDQSGNRFIIASHSPSLINAPNVSVTHVTKTNGISYARSISGITEARDILDDIGAHASDLLQSNYVVWVEGPSDRVYINAWIHELDDSLIEGVHYSVVTYGGALLNSFTASSAIVDSADDFIELMRINQHFCVLMDSDKTSASRPINETKKRLKKECEASGNLAWVTWGATIENYYPGDEIAHALEELYPNEAYDHQLNDRYVHPLRFSFKGRKAKAPDKIKVARILAGVPILQTDYGKATRLVKDVSGLVSAIRAASGLVER